MHGRPRTARTAGDAEASAAQASLLRALQSNVISYHENRNYSKEAMDESAQLLIMNPEFQTGWNYRKLAVQHNLGQRPGSVPENAEEELQLVESALKHNFKSYGAWYHRKWLISKGYCSPDSEMKLLNLFQKADSRNFHAWSHRRFVAGIKSISDEEELKQTEGMIDTNFSNYSAWHNRSLLLSKLMREKAPGFNRKEKVLEEELDRVHQALFTDPDDQSSWFYYNWLLQEMIKRTIPSTYPLHEQPTPVEEEKISWDEENFSPHEVQFEEQKLEEKEEDPSGTAMVSNEIDLFRELLSETNCKIGKLMLCRMLVSQRNVSEDEYAEALELYDDLMKLDPPHAELYKDESSRTAIQQAVSSRDRLLGNCWRYSGNPTPDSSPFCVRLNGKCISRLGCAERLTFVRMLDLRNNELRTLEGLETLKLLRHLNLSGNRIRSFTAMEPLRLLKSLATLDVSHNLIASSSAIDTTRYLCSSPLSHGGRDSGSENEWEPWLFFKEIAGLRQLDVAGNPVCCEGFKRLLRKALPHLRWLDGEWLL